MNFRVMANNDISEVTNVFINAYSEPPWNEKWNYEKAFKRIKEVFDTQNSICLVCLYQQKIVGAIQCLLIPWTYGYQLDIRDIFVDNRFQNMAIGTQMLKYLPNVLPKDEPVEIVLSTKRNTKLMKFYEKNGFSINDEFVFYSKSI